MSEDTDSGDDIACDGICTKDTSTMEQDFTTTGVLTISHGQDVVLHLEATLRKQILTSDCNKLLKFMDDLFGVSDDELLGPRGELHTDMKITLADEHGKVITVMSFSGYEAHLDN